MTTRDIFLKYRSGEYDWISFFYADMEIFIESNGKCFLSREFIVNGEMHKINVSGYADQFEDLEKAISLLTSSWKHTALKFIKCVALGNLIPGQYYFALPA